MWNGLFVVRQPPTARHVPLQAAGYLALALYLDKVLPGGDQAPAPQPWYFLLTRSYWWPDKASRLRGRDAWVD